MCVFIVIMSILSSSTPYTASDTLQNEHIRAVITPVTMGVRAGSLTELTDLATGIDLAGGRQFGGVQCGPFIPSPGEIEHLSDTSAVFRSYSLSDYSRSIELPIAVTITYVLVGRGLEISVAVVTTGEVELEYPLEMDISVGLYNSIIFGNQSTTNGRTLNIHGDSELCRFSGDQVMRFIGDVSLPELTILLPNPAKNMLAVNTGTSVDNYLSLLFFDMEAPRENCLGPDLHSILPAGDESSYYARILVGDAPAVAYISGHPDGFERTASWIMDEIPFIHPQQGDLWGYSTTSSGDERVTAQMIQLLEEHPEMKMNWLLLPDGILTDNRDSVWYEDGYEDSWSHWHSTWRMSTEAPQDYLDWLLNIQNNVYPWADRVALGNHGYHHTPNPDSSFGEYHEFITYEPDEHMERFRVCMNDIADMGLDTSMVRTIRYSGHRTSLSGLWATIAYGFDFYCNGIRWWEWTGGEYFYDQHITKFQTPSGRIWGTNTVWWGDFHSQQPYEYLSTVLERGKHCLLGAHPINMLAPTAWPEPYDRIDSVCTSMETDYSHFGWLLPIEYGDFLEDCYGSDVTSIRFKDNGLTFSFTGSTSHGQTLVAEIPEEAVVLSVLVNGSHTDWEERIGSRLFISIDGLGLGDHVVEVAWNDTGIEEIPDTPANTAQLSAISPSIDQMDITGSGFPAGICNISLFDISGRLVVRTEVLTDPTGDFSLLLPWRSIDGRCLPAGVYSIIAVSGRSSAHRSVIHLFN